MRHAAWRRLLPDLGYEVLLIAAFLKAYNIIRNQLSGCHAIALSHASDIIALEQQLGIFWEADIQAWALLHTPSMAFWNIFYGTTHGAVTVAVLFSIFTTHPAAYQWCRNVFVAMNLLALIGYAAYPLMPPRLLADCGSSSNGDDFSERYGSCLSQLAFVDTLETIGGTWSWRDEGITGVTNQYAAMPSMHAGYAFWCAWAVCWALPEGRVARAAAVIYAVAVLYCIVVTGNHFFLDILGAFLALLLAICVASYLPRVGRGARTAVA